MNVIITGGYGFIGSFVSERFYKEGHRIYIIDNLTTGQKSNVTIPHKFYRMSVHDLNCEQLFQSISPDVVIHLAAQVDVVTSVNEPHADTQSNILGLVNILRCSHKTKVKKLIFASSAAVYGPYEKISLKEDMVCGPVSPYGINKYLGEYYCEKWKELYGLKTLCFRFSNVYGPRQGSKGEGGVVSVFMERIRDGKELNVYGDGGQTRDFIYVEDVVDAIYRGANSEEVTGVYNLSTDTETSVNQLIEIIGSLKETGKVNYLDSRPGDIYRSSLDNTRVKRDLDWAPIYSIQNGLTRTFEWFTQSFAPIREQTKEGVKEYVRDDNRKVKDELQRFSINAKISIGRIHGIIKALESTVPEEIIVSSVSVLSNLMETDKISVYAVNESDFLRIAIKSNATDFNLPKTIRLSEHPNLHEAINSGKLFVNKTMNADLPTLAAPISYEGKAVALVSVHEPSLDKINPDYENLFELSIDMIAGSLSRAFRYVGVTRKERYVDETKVLSPAFFEQVLQIRISAKQRYNSDYVLLDIDSTNRNITALANLISGNLREMDSLGMIKERLVLLLSNSNKVEADSVIQRLSEHGIRATIINEDQLYVRESTI
ncbi:NAD-dependent epimerase/dehydratase family protein [Cohnella cholangitidis]|uniref:NAD-dependent epimerase/dehydratase family protein n=1 Tax=Cohnella cholangitidis TaxID=2598458 RepID=A0A7G5BWP4_9BACL|nr:NAD-dependent epimerase/dehydratase family protein [Cohnella cholangitidis]QMV41378.1 NAD-dependent epimerase/dehydratase family protein [Cohnella cholangitidis]